ncbi:MAG: amidohydrolase [Candidatus Thorarchaeota archaeon]
MNQHRLYFVVSIILTLLISFPMILASQGFWVEAAELSPDTIIHNGEILTMEQSPAQVEALAIQGESILAIGNESDILAMAGPNTRLIDLEGRTLLPGFIDSHAHYVQGWSDGGFSTFSTPDEAVDFALSCGWTSYSSMCVNPDRLEQLRTLDEQDRLRIRVNAYLQLSWEFYRLGDWYQAYQPGQEFSSKLRIGGVKIFMDYWWMEWVHYFNQTELDILVQEAHEAGFQIAIHSVVDNATDIVLNSLESVLEGQSNELYRHRIEHLVLLRDDQIQRMSNLGIIASFQLPWCNSDSIPDFTQFYQDYSHIVGRWRDIVQAGMPSIGSTDFSNYFPDSVGSAMDAISMAVTKIGYLELAPPDWMLNQSLSVEQALRLITIDAAYGTFQEDVKGSIKVGKLADLVILSDNPLTVPEDSLADIEVLLTMIGGRIEYTKEGSGFPTPPPRPLQWYDILPPGLVFIFFFMTFAVVVFFKKKGGSSLSSINN